MKKQLLIPALLFSAALLSSCGGGHKNNPETKDDPALTGPINKLTFAQAGDTSFDRKRVEMSGFVRLPTMFMSTDRLNFDLLQRKNQDGNDKRTIYVTLPVGSDKNTVKALP